MEYCFDSTFIRDNAICISGWVVGEEKENSIEIKAYNKQHQELPVKETHTTRSDVGMAKFQDASVVDVGIFLEVPCASRESICLVFIERDAEKNIVKKKNIWLSEEKLIRQEQLKKMKQSLQEPKEILKNVKKKLLKSDERIYADWFHTMRANSLELMQQRKTKFDYEPKFSILVPVYNTPLRFLRDMIQSVLRQSYRNWELCIVNASPENEKLSKELHLWQQSDVRIHVKELQKNQGIAENTNAAFEMAAGEFIAMLDHDDMIEPDALFSYVQLLNQDADLDIFYSDEDKITEQSDYYFYPHFKSDFNLDLLYSNNYMCHFLAVRKSVAEAAGGWDSAFDGAQDYDFILRCIEQSKRVAHVQKVLYHWRSHNASTAKKQENKKYAFDAGVEALNMHYKRVGIPATAENGAVAGWYVSHYSLTEMPLVSVLIPNKDHKEDLDTCIRSIKEKCTYKNVEIIVIENNSTKPETFEYYQELESRYNNVQVVYWKEGFNYSAINNFGFQYCKGDYIMLLNNDVEVISEDLFESMLGYCMRQDVGIVGARLLYNDNTVQHAGVIVGIGGLANHAFKGKKDSEPGYMCRSISTQDMSAVTAACLMVKRSVYEEVGGLEEYLEVAFNDVDFCLKVRQAGYLVVYDAQAKLYHYESKSRGIEDSSERCERFEKESNYLQNTWHIFDTFEDPYYNPNLSQTEEYFQLNLVVKLERADAQSRKLGKWLLPGQEAKDS